MYYLTEMNTLKLENTLLQFIYKTKLNSKLVNGVTTKIIAIMHKNKIDYFYSDLLATNLNVPINFVDKIYLKNQSQYYEDPLSKLLTNTDYQGTPEDATQLEEDVTEILKTKKRIHYTKHYHNNKGGVN